MEQIISASGIQYGMIITPEGSVPISGALSISTTTGSNIFVNELPPVNAIYNNEKIKLVYSGAEIGSIFKYIGTGSYVQTLTWSGTVLTNISSWTSGTTL